VYVFKPLQVNNQAAEAMGEDEVLRRTVGDGSHELVTPTKVAGASSESTFNSDLGVPDGDEVLTSVLLYVRYSHQLKRNLQCFYVVGAKSWNVFAI
jgi:hypothetical protein